MKQQIPVQCPVCERDSLEVDEEYMLANYGTSYVNMPFQEWSFYCRDSDCEFAGLWEEFFEMRKTK